MRTALITGATSGIGKALADDLAKRGFSLILTGRDRKKLLGRNLALDLSDPQERKKLMELIRKEIPELIVNNAGFGLYGASCELSIEEQLQMIEVNVKAPMEISMEAAKALLQAERPGTILNISSAAAFFAYPLFNTYAASKACLLNFSLALDAELRKKGIRVLCACPGPIVTDFRRRASKGIIYRVSGMSVEKAVHCLWRQIERKKPLSLFDWRTYLLVTFVRLLPRSLQESLLRHSITFLSQ